MAVDGGPSDVEEDANAVAEVSLPAVDAGPGEVLLGDLTSPRRPAGGLVVFAHGSGSSRLSGRNRWVAGELRRRGTGTLLMDLLTADEETCDARTGHLRFDIELLTRRVLGVLDWLETDERTRGVALGLFGASTGAAAALGAAAKRPETVRAVVSRGGRPDLATEPLGGVRAPVLLLVGGRDDDVVELNRKAAELLGSGPGHELRLVGGATHLFEEHGALEQVAGHAATWFERCLR